MRNHAPIPDETDRIAHAIVDAAFAVHKELGPVFSNLSTKFVCATSFPHVEYYFALRFICPFHIRA
jgi:hypothetical protein